jgi:nucleoside 2-deoxyribosyltransferase
MKFGDAVLDRFVGNVLKPAVKTGIGYQLLAMRDIARAGIIDNIMRAQIRDATFVIVDLTHDNAGAYWEAGYAEGLGKPVIYICERSKFDEAQTPFDTNHCTTVLWSDDDRDNFSRELIATLRRSLNLFPGTA